VEIKESTWTWRMQARTLAIGSQLSSGDRDRPDLRNSEGKEMVKLRISKISMHTLLRDTAATHRDLTPKISNPTLKW